jgi:rubrerythrin
MTTTDARKVILEDLKAAGLLKEIEPLSHNVGTCYRCHHVIEPMVSKQWFVKMEELAKPAIEAVRDGRIKFVPERFSKNYFHWMENIRDWCISRQLWWGHRIPAYYCEECGEMVVSRESVDVCPKCGAEVSASSAFCALCGAPMPAEKPAASGDVLVCASCGTILEQGMRFCTNCGRPVAKTAPAPVVPPVPVEAAPPAPDPIVPPVAPEATEPEMPMGFSAPEAFGEPAAFAPAPAEEAVESVDPAPAQELPAEETPTDAEPAAVETVEEVPNDSAPAAPVQMTCPGCGAPIEPDDAFCMNCGTKL